MKRAGRKSMNSTASVERNPDDAQLTLTLRKSCRTVCMIFSTSTQESELAIYLMNLSKGGAKSVAKYFVLWAIQAIVTALIIAGLEMLFDGTNGIVYFLIISAVKTAIFFASYTVQKKWVFSDKKQEK